MWKLDCRLRNFSANYFDPQLSTQFFDLEPVSHTMTDAESSVWKRNAEVFAELTDLTLTDPNLIEFSSIGV
jgi:hypothetical protein